MSKYDGTITIDNVVMKIHQPDGVGPFPVLLMIHGWTGDENSMWIFSSRLPKNALMIAPRGLYSTAGSGYSWHPAINTPLPGMDDFVPTVEKLFDTISGEHFQMGDFSALHVVGFSQGAALAYTMTILYPERITSLAGLSGFLPDGASAWLRTERLRGLPVFIAHGTEDERVPVEHVRMAVAQLEQSGAKVTYCEDNVGHKLSAKCFHGLEAFYKKEIC